MTPKSPPPRDGSADVDSGVASAFDRLVPSRDGDLSRVEFLGKQVILTLVGVIVMFATVFGVLVGIAVVDALLSVGIVYVAVAAVGVAMAWIIGNVADRFMGDGW